MSTEPQQKALLFKRIPIDQLRNHGIFNSLFGDVLEEKWKAEHPDQTEVLQFITEVKSHKEAAAIVRRDPNARWAMFSGVMTDIQVAIPVFINGVNADTHDAEWS